MKKIALSLGTVALSAVLARAQFAAAPPDVTAVEIDYTQNLLHIQGVSFVASGLAPSVFLAGTPLTLVGQATSTLLVADLPPAFTAGSYELKVLKPSNGKTDVFEVTVGAVGPQGEPGTAGRGIAAAVVAVNGDLIVSYTDGTTANWGYVVGPAGAAGPQGPKGDKGDPGATGPQGLSIHWRGAWSNATSYAVNDAVSFNGSAYIAVAAGTSAAPDTSPAAWNLLASVGATDFASLTGKPTTLAGYGIADGITAAAASAGYQPLDADLTAIAALTTTGFGRGLLTEASATTALSLVTSDQIFVAVSYANTPVIIGSPTPLPGGSATDKLQVLGTARISDTLSLQNGLNITDGGFEYSGAIPFIDFHYGFDPNDYNVRLINDGSGQLSVIGSFRTTADVLVGADMHIAASRVIYGDGTLHIQSLAGGPLHLNPWNMGGDVIVGASTGSGNLYVKTKVETTSLVANAISSQIAPTDAGGGLTVNSKLTVKDTGTDVALELYGTTPAVDFHYNNSGLNFTARLIADTVNRLRVDGHFHVNGNITASGTITSSSDGRLKTDIVTLNGALESVRKMRGVFYRWNTNAEHAVPQDPQRQIGFIAQELRSVLPEVVKEDAEGYLSVAYASLAPLLVEAAKEQDRHVATLESEVAEIKRQNTETRRQLAELRRQNMTLTQQAATGQKLRGLLEDRLAAIEQLLGEGQRPTAQQVVSRHP